MQEMSHEGCAVIADPAVLLLVRDVKQSNVAACRAWDTTTCAGLGLATLVLL